MLRAALSLAAAAGLAACGQETAPAARDERSALDQPPPIPVMGPRRIILAYGDSVLAGSGSAPGDSYPGMLEAALRARGVDARVVDSGLAGETSGQALGRLPETLDGQPVEPEVIVVSIGSNDMLRGVPPAQTRANLARILSMLRDRGIRVVLLGVMAAPNLSADFARQFNPIYPTLARQYDAVLVPFFLQPGAAAADADNLQGDSLQPIAHGAEELVVATIDDVIEALPER
ncbi:arylesterase [Novosphingobium sp. M1R2S20]|uniref:Arylesterase n=1 Tax=Novosphingobium rhizovicinum TaxID=3228928 RepID=A0ABV3RFC0_9SPHN